MNLRFWMALSWMLWTTSWTGCQLGHVEGDTLPSGPENATPPGPNASPADPSSPDPVQPADPTNPPVNPQPQPQPQPQPDPSTALPGWKLLWSDEFDKNGLPDPSKWGYDVGGGGWGNGEAQFYTDARIDNAEVKDGKLLIIARQESFQGKNYTSTRLISKNKGDWLYGRFEVKARIPGGRGSWPAIWMLPTDWKYGNWPNSGEIDIMEHVGFQPNVLHGTVHTQAYNHTIGTQRGAATTINDALTAFHVYAIEWSATQIDVYVDTQKYFTFQNENNGSAVWPFDQRFHFLFNIAIGGAWGGAQGIDDTIFPIQMEIDYARVYQKS